MQGLDKSTTSDLDATHFKRPLSPVVDQGDEEQSDFHQDANHVVKPFEGNAGLSVAL